MPFSSPSFSPTIRTKPNFGGQPPTGALRSGSRWLDCLIPGPEIDAAAFPELRTAAPGQADFWGLWSLHPTQDVIALRGITWRLFHLGYGSWGRWLLLPNFTTWRKFPDVSSTGWLWANYMIDLCRPYSVEYKPVIWTGK